MKFALLGAAMLGLCWNMPVAAAPQLALGTASGTPGSATSVTNQFISEVSVVALQYDVLFDGGKLGAASAFTGNALLDHQLFLSSPGPGTSRVVVYSLSNAQLSNGVLAQLYFTIAANAPVGATAVTFTNGILASPAGQAIDGANYVPGSITIVAGPARLGTVARAQNGLVQFEVTGSYNGNYVIQASNNLIDWTPLGTNIAVNGIIQLQDNDSAIFPTRFYRAVVAR